MSKYNIQFIKDGKEHKGIITLDNDNFTLKSEDEDNINLQFSIYQVKLIKIGDNEIDIRCESHIGESDFTVLFENISEIGNFKEEFYKYSVRETLPLFYDNGDVRFMGPFVEDKANGENGREFYEGRGNALKYFGQVKDANHNGHGQFYDKDGELELTLYNIQAGEVKKGTKADLKFYREKKYVLGDYRKMPLFKTLEPIHSVVVTFSEDISVDDIDLEKLAMLKIPNYKSIVFRNQSLQNQILELKNNMERIESCVDELYHPTSFQFNNQNQNQNNDIKLLIYGSLSIFINILIGYYFF